MYATWVSRAACSIRKGRAASSSRNCNRKPGKKVVEKRLPNAFSGTELHDLLQNHGRLDLIVCGFMTHSSVSTTVRAAKDYGYRCTLADSACATRDIPTLNGGVLSAADLQRAEIAALGDNFAAIVAQARELL